VIYFLDNFLSQELLDEFLQDNSEFFEFPTGDESFWVRLASDKFNQYVISEIESIENKKVKNILSFFREAKEGQDNDWRIHNDSIILNEQPDRAIVLFMESEESEELNGTAFWEHKKYGDVYTKDGFENFDEILKTESEKREAWTLKSVIGYKQNRLLSYPCRYFHSKYPKEFKEPRRVFVMFYKVN
jgi:hypothetical protein